MVNSVTFSTPARTQGGTQVTIFGSNFGSQVSVTIGGSACDITQSVTPSQIICSSPAGQGASKPVVVTNYGLMSNNDRTFSYATPSVTVSFFGLI